MSKIKINSDQIALETKTQILSEVKSAVHHLLYNRDQIDPATGQTYSNISTIQLFTHINSKLITTSGIINAFAKELRKEVE